MMPKAESASLKEYPLPVLVNTPDHIAELDMEISRMMDRVKALQSERDVLLERSVSENMLEGERYHIVKREKKLPRTLDIVKFRECFPDEFLKIIDLQLKNAREKAENGITIRNAEVFVKPKVLEENGIYQDNGVKELWEVVRKDLL